MDSPRSPISFSWLFRRSSLHSRTLANWVHEYIICEEMGISKSKGREKLYSPPCFRLLFSLQNIWFDNKKPSRTCSACGHPARHRMRTSLQAVSGWGQSHGSATDFPHVKSFPKNEEPGALKNPCTLVLASGRENPSDGFQLLRKEEGNPLVIKSDI